MSRDDITSAQSLILPTMEAEQSSPAPSITSHCIEGMSLRLSLTNALGAMHSQLGLGGKEAVPHSLSLCSPNSPLMPRTCTAGSLLGEADKRRLSSSSTPQSLDFVHPNTKTCQHSTVETATSQWGQLQENTSPQGTPGRPARQQTPATEIPKALWGWQGTINKPNGI